VRRLDTAHRNCKYKGQDQEGKGNKDHVDNAVEHAVAHSVLKKEVLIETFPNYLSERMLFIGFWPTLNLDDKKRLTRCGEDRSQEGERIGKDDQAEDLPWADLSLLDHVRAAD
jgi:hypothetical protein